MRRRITSTDLIYRLEPSTARLAVRKIVDYALSILLPLCVWLAPLRLPATAKHALAVSTFMIVAWITQILPHAITGLVGCYLFWTLNIVKFSTAFGGFAEQTPWFLFGGMLLGMMATKSGLARRLAYFVMLRVGTGYDRLLLGIILSSFILTLLVPSGVACVVIIAALALGLLEVFGLSRGSNVGRGMFITLTCTAATFDKMVISGPASVLGRGLIQQATKVEVYWSLWLLAFLPCVGITIFFLWRVVLWLYPPESEALAGGAEFLNEALKKMGPWSLMEKRSLILLLATFALWTTDLIHHISPAVIGIGAGLLAAVPEWGVLDQEDLKRINYFPLIFVAAAGSMGGVLIETHALSSMAAVMFAWMRPWITGPFSLSQIPYWTAFVYHIFLGNEISMLATSVPPLMEFAKSAGIPAVPLGLVWVFAAGGKIFVYQSGVLIVGFSYGYFSGKDMFRVGLCLTVVESLALLFVVPFYWPLLGIR